ncbi:O-antigen ligase [Brevundimonas variabilis]|uniref:O-antigen ligase n=1 Tax=Brevundimonas variabilis TaxID=74312 RepID=A0A7W9CIL8_9CAUL|nr:O-antigen ligase [Brevundimonas variabilis]
MPVLVTGAHLAGGASGQFEATLLTAVIALIGAYGFVRGRVGLTTAYWRDLRGPAVAFAGLLVLAVVSVIPGSDWLASGWIAERAGLNTLSIDPEATWVEIVKLLGLLVIFLLAYRHASTAERMTSTLHRLVWLTVGWALWALILFAMSARSVDGIARLTGTFVSPNVAACVLSLGLLCWMTLIDRQLQSRKGALNAGLLTSVAAGVILAGTLLLTASRSAILIMALLGAIWAGRRVWTWLTHRSVLRGRRLLLTGLVLGGLLVVAYSASAVLLRMGSVGEEVTNRSVIMATYAEAVSANPVFGQGLGTVPRISRLLLTPENDGVMWNVRAVHNLALQWILEAGVVGLLMALIGGVWLVLVTVARLRPDMRTAMLPLFMVSGFMLLQGMVDYPAQIYSVALVWAFLLGLVYRAATSWAGIDAKGPIRHQQRRTGVSPRETKHDTQKPIRRELPGKRAGRAVRHG